MSKMLLIKHVRILLLLTITIIAQAGLLYAVDEHITITAYHPSPKGIYSELRLQPKDNPSVSCKADVEGTMYYDKDDGRLKICTQDVNGLYGYFDLGFSKNMVMPWHGSNRPAGWQLCDGTNGTPDLKDRFIKGSSALGNYGDGDGYNFFTLDISKMPSHSHTVEWSGSTDVAGYHNHRMLVYDDCGLWGLGQITWPFESKGAVSCQTRRTGVEHAGDHSHQASFRAFSSVVGSDNPRDIDNEPEYYALAYICYTGD